MGAPLVGAEGQANALQELRYYVSNTKNNIEPDVRTWTAKSNGGSDCTHLHKTTVIRPCMHSTNMNISHVPPEVVAQISAQALVSEHALKFGCKLVPTQKLQRT